MKTIRMKKLAAFLIALALMLSLIPTQVWAAPTTERYGLTAISALENGEDLIWAYNKLRDGVEACEARISFKDATHSISVSDFQMVLAVYQNDNPQHFWFGASYSNAPDGDNMAFVKPHYSFTGDALTAARSAYDAAVAKALSGITADMSDYEKELYLHDYLAKHVDYTDTGYNAHTAYGALVEGKAVCEGYARAFQQLLTLAGIPSYVVSGRGRYEDHAWNLVKIDGAYYYVDLTWDDKGDEPLYAYFNITTQQLTEDHTIDPMPYELPICTATAANYYTINGGKVSIGDVEAIADLLDKGNLFARLYVTGNVDEFAVWFAENVNSIAQAVGLTEFQDFDYTTAGTHGINIRIIADNYTHHHRMGKVDAVAATCKDTGSVEYWHCFRCDKNYADSEGKKELSDPVTAIDPDNHVGGTEIRNQVTASCEKNGYSGDTYCKGCGEKLSSGTTSPKTHSMSFIAAVPSTCKDAGTKEHWHCSKCNKDFSDEAGDTVLKDLSLPLDSSNHIHFKDGWEYDAEGHWQICADCTTGKGEKTVHTYGGASGNICGICGYAAPTAPVKGDLNGNGTKADIGDVQCLYTYLTAGSISGAYKNDKDTFIAVADVNEDGTVDVYDLQLLYEAASGISSL